MFNEKKFNQIGLIEQSKDVHIFRNKYNFKEKRMRIFNRTIIIYRSDVEKMKSQIENRMSDIWDIYHFESQLDEEHIYMAISSNEVWAELCRTKYLCNKVDNLLADENFDFICVDADEWFEEWDFEERIEKGLIDKYYMFPDSDEVDKIFEKLKSNYKYTVEDLFGVYRFYPIGANTVVA